MERLPPSCQYEYEGSGRTVKDILHAAAAEYTGLDLIQPYQICWIAAVDFACGHSSKTFVINQVRLQAAT